jgi:hypothetical protein
MSLGASVEARMSAVSSAHINRRRTSVSTRNTGTLSRADMCVVQTLRSKEDNSKS